MIKKFLWIPAALLMVTFLAVSWRSGATNNSDKTVHNSSVAAASTAKSLSTEGQFAQFATNVYDEAQLSTTGLDEGVFQKALTGFYNLKAAHKLPQGSNIITVVDLSKSSCTKRMWIVDVLNHKLLLNTWVAHGQGSGDDIANHFSDTNESHQSSLGFYVTDDIYFGKHGRSLRLDGMDEGFNSHARQRAVVLHAADYVSQATINTLGRLGRSFGCPAVSPLVIDYVINTLKGKTMLFINGNDNHYNSKYLNTTMAAGLALAGNNTAAADSAAM